MMLCTGLDGAIVSSGENLRLVSVSCFEETEMRRDIDTTGVVGRTW